MSCISQDCRPKETLRLVAFLRYFATTMTKITHRLVQSCYPSPRDVEVGEGKVQNHPQLLCRTTHPHCSFRQIRKGAASKHGFVGPLKLLLSPCFTPLFKALPIQLHVVVLLARKKSRPRKCKVRDLDSVYTRRRRRTIRCSRKKPNLACFEDWVGFSQKKMGIGGEQEVEGIMSREIIRWEIRRIEIKQSRESCTYCRQVPPSYPSTKPEVGKSLHPIPPLHF